MLFVFRSKKGSPYNIFGAILLIFAILCGVFLLRYVNNSPDENPLGRFLFVFGGMALVLYAPGLYICETFWWRRYERASLAEKQAMINKLVRKRAAKDFATVGKAERKKTYKDGWGMPISWTEHKENEYRDKFYKKYGNPMQEAAQNEEQRIWEEAYRRATPEQKERMTKERDEQEAYKRLSPEEKQRRKEQEEFERKVQSTLNRY